MRTKMTATSLTLVAITLLIASGCQSTAVADVPTWGRALVTGTLADLKAFEQTFKEVLGDSNLEAHQIGCVEGCDKLSSGPAPTRLVYVFPRELSGVFSMFGDAWDLSQRSTGSTTLWMTFDANLPPPTCGLPHPQPCQSMPYCSDLCGRKVGGCNAC